MAQQKWNLGDIRPPDKTKRTRRSTPKEPVQSGVSQQHDISSREEEMAHMETERPRTKKRKSGGSRRRYVIYAIAIAVFLIIGLVVAAVLEHATVTVYPKTKDAVVQATFTAYQAPAAGELGYEMLTLESEATKSVPATGEEAVEVQAQGSITIYNAYSATPQRLIKNTRFAAPDGKIFRIKESVEVPGYTKDGDGGVIPGTITAKVFADAAGEDYNIGPAKFTIPGLEGSEQYDKMHAESTEPFTGGFVGTQLIVDDAVLADAQKELRESLARDLREKLASERPNGYVVFDEAAEVDFTSLSAEETDTGEALLREKGTLRVPMFPEAAFASYVAANTLAGYEGEPVRIQNLDDLALARAAERATSTAEQSSESFDFRATGDARIVYDFDEDAFAADIAGKSQTAVQSVLAKYPALDERVEVKIRPFWSRTLPDTTDEIEVIEVTQP